MRALIVRSGRLVRVAADDRIQAQAGTVWTGDRVLIYRCRLHHGGARRGCESG